MAGLRFTETEIAIRIVPKRLRWPKSGSSIAWTKAHACVDALRGLVRSIDMACIEVEQSHELAPGPTLGKSDSRLLGTKKANSAATYHDAAYPDRRRVPRRADALQPRIQQFSQPLVHGLDLLRSNLRRGRCCSADLWSHRNGIGRCRSLETRLGCRRAAHCCLGS